MQLERYFDSAAYRGSDRIDRMKHASSDRPDRPKPSERIRWCGDTASDSTSPGPLVLFSSRPHLLINCNG
jgi:hypothetical protein